MWRFSILGLVTILGLTACHFDSKQPLFGPDDFEALAFNYFAYRHTDDEATHALEIFQYGRQSGTFAVRSVTGDGEVDALMETGFVQLKPNLYLIQITGFTLDGPPQTDRFSLGDRPAPDLGKDPSGADDTVFTYGFLETVTGERTLFQRTDTGINGFTLYLTFKTDADEAVEALGETYGIALDGYTLPEDPDLSADTLKAFFLEVFETQKAANLFSDVTSFEGDPRGFK